MKRSPFFRFNRRTSTAPATAAAVRNEQAERFSGVFFGRWIHPVDLIVGLGLTDVIAALTARGLSGQWGTLPADPDRAAVHLLITVLSAAALLPISTDLRLFAVRQGLCLPEKSAGAVTTPEDSSGNA